jgi:hypothetical protein
MSTQHEQHITRSSTYGVDIRILKGNWGNIKNKINRAQTKEIVIKKNIFEKSY